MIINKLASNLFFIILFTVFSNKTTQSQSIKIEKNAKLIISKDTNISSNKPIFKVTSLSIINQGLLSNSGKFYTNSKIDNQGKYKGNGNINLSGAGNIEWNFKEDTIKNLLIDIKNQLTLNSNLIISDSCIINNGIINMQSFFLYIAKIDFCNINSNHYSNTFIKGFLKAQVPKDSQFTYYVGTESVKCQPITIKNTLEKTNNIECKYENGKKIFPLYNNCNDTKNGEIQFGNWEISSDSVIKKIQLYYPKSYKLSMEYACLNVLQNKVLACNNNSDGSGFYEIHSNQSQKYLIRIIGNQENKKIFILKNAMPQQKNNFILNLKLGLLPPFFPNKKVKN